jgi:hypothetical protein
MSAKKHYTPTYQSWQAMRQRCLNPKHTHFGNYGGKGVVICAEWASYEQFLADMGVRPNGMSLERKDNTKGYCRGNCCWASRTEQNRNNSQNRLVTYCGQTKCLAEWCEELHLNYARTYARLYRLNWSPANAFN